MIKISNDTIRRFLIIIFALISIVSLGGFGYIFFMTAFAVGWSGSNISTWELIWINKGPLLFFLISLIAAVGLKKRKSIGIICGFTVPFSFMIPIVHFEYLHYKQDINSPPLIDVIFNLIVWLIIPVLIIICVDKLRKEHKNFGLLNYLVTGGLILLLGFSSIIMFSF